MKAEQEKNGYVFEKSNNGGRRVERRRQGSSRETKHRVRKI